MPKPVPLSRNPGRTRRRLLDTAIRLFATDGFHGVSVDRIVAAAGVNKRMVYHYFGSKEDIYRAAFVEVFARIERAEFGAVDVGGTPRDKLMRLFEAYFRFLDENPEFVRLLLWENLDRGRHIVRVPDRVNKIPFLVRFRQIITEGVRRRQFREDLDVRHLLIHLIGLCFIYHSNRYSLSQTVGLDLGRPGIKAAGRRRALALVLGGIER